MIEESQERPPDGGEEAEKVEVGEPTRDTGDSEQRAREEEQPDLDERQRRISTRRKPMGPPPKESEEGRAEPPERETPSEPPTDPSEP